MAAFTEKMRGVGADISDETRQKRSEAAKAQHADPTAIAIHKVATTKSNQDPEKRRLIAEKAKARWADQEKDAGEVQDKNLHQSIAPT